MVWGVEIELNREKARCRGGDNPTKGQSLWADKGKAALGGHGEIPKKSRLKTASFSGMYTREKRSSEEKKNPLVEMNPSGFSGGGTDLRKGSIKKKKKGRPGLQVRSR